MLDSNYFYKPVDQLFLNFSMDWNHTDAVLQFQSFSLGPLGMGTENLYF